MGERCEWCGTDPLYVAYHDDEWGVPEGDGKRLFELLTLEGFQSGLSWITILRKREAFRAAFAEFDPARVAAFGEADIARLLGDAGIVRHRGKIEATISNARVVIEIEATGGFAEFIWSYVDGTPLQTGATSLSEIPSQTELSTRLSRHLKKRGFRFCGPTTVYAFMQAAGLVNDHVLSCPRRAEVAALRPAL